jgi:hydroxypyruvate reductase
VTLVYSDVSSGALADVASGPTIWGQSEPILIADNDTLTAAAASIAPGAVRCERQIESDVSAAATLLLDLADKMKPGEVLVAGGEPTVKIHGDGRGGRCSELAVRVALGATKPMEALFGSSDGVDGNSGVAGIRVSLPVTFDRTFAERELARSNSFEIASAIGEPLTIVPSGNNLRDLYLLARS